MNSTHQSGCSYVDTTCLNRYNYPMSKQSFLKDPRKLLFLTGYFLVFLGIFFLLQSSPLAENSKVLTEPGNLNSRQQFCLDKYGTLERSELSSKVDGVYDDCFPLYSCPDVVFKHKYYGFPFTTGYSNGDNAVTFSCSGLSFEANSKAMMLNFVVLFSLYIALTQAGFWGFKKLMGSK